jgi:hypothetical protein
VCKYACAHVFPPHFSWMLPTSHLFEVYTSGALPPRLVSKLVTISADPTCLPNPSPGGVVLVALPSARRTQRTLPPPPQKRPPGGVMQLQSPLVNPPRALQRPLPSRRFKRRRMLIDMPPLRLLHLAETILLLAPHLAVTLPGESHHWLRRVKGWDKCLHSPPCGMPGGVVAVVPYILLVMVAN